MWYNVTFFPFYYKNNFFVGKFLIFFFSLNLILKIKKQKKKKKTAPEAREIAQWLGALVALSGKFGSIPSIHMMAHDLQFQRIPHSRRIPFMSSRRL